MLITRSWDWTCNLQIISLISTLQPNASIRCAMLEVLCMWLEDLKKAEGYISWNFENMLEKMKNPNTLSDKYYQASSQKFRQIIKKKFKFFFIVRFTQYWKNAISVRFHSCDRLLGCIISLKQSEEYHRKNFGYTATTTKKAFQLSEYTWFRRYSVCDRMT